VQRRSQSVSEPYERTLSGVKVLEIAGIGPGPFCGMLLADMGADVLRIDRLEAADLGLPLEARFEVMSRGRARGAGPENPEAILVALDLAERADVLIEGFRPGVMERLGLGPDVCLARILADLRPHHRLGQHGPLAHAPATISTT